MHDSLPTMQLLKNRGIIDNGLCPLRNYEEESNTRRFLLCHFARACWHGLPLVVHTSDLIDIFVQQWLRELIVSHNLNELFLWSMCRAYLPHCGPYGITRISWFTKENNQIPWK